MRLLATLFCYVIGLAFLYASTAPGIDLPLHQPWNTEQWICAQLLVIGLLSMIVGSFILSTERH